MAIKRVVVTGLGLVSPLGGNCQKSWSRLVKGDCAIQSTVELGPEYGLLTSRVAAWIRDSELTDFLSNGVCIGSGMAPLDVIGEAYTTLAQKGPRRVSPHFIPRILPNMAAGHVSIRFGLRGPLLAPSTACATGAHAVGDAFRLIKHGYANAMVAGGTEAAINPLAIAGFAQARALSTVFNNDPEQSSRPFDERRDGFELEHALQRKAKIYAEIVGYGCSADAHHITSSQPEGSGAESAMRRAVKEAQLLPKDVQHVNAHATSTPIGDLAELSALQRLFSNVTVTANKGSIGHLLGAAGAVESVLTILSLYHSLIPPTLNYQGKHSVGGVTMITGRSQPDPNLRVALCNSFGFGGTNVSLCFTTIK